MKKRITVALSQSILLYPPAINLIENLLTNGYGVNLVANEIDALPDIILKNPNFSAFNIPLVKGNDYYHSWKRMIIRKKYLKIYVQKAMKNAEFLWTLSDQTVKDLGDIVLKYKHIMQLMELIAWTPRNPGLERVPILKGLLKTKLLRFPIQKYAQSAWKVVVPEINRAYIERVWLDLPKLPVVLPNKPYKIKVKKESEVDNRTKLALQKIKEEKRKVIVYLGIIFGERNLDTFAEAVNKLGKDYCLYVIGKTPFPKDLEHLKRLKEKYSNIEYLGYFKAPDHLLFLKYCHIGLLPYYPSAKKDRYSLGLNVLYCAPNKIFEYSAFGLPMLGTDVLGLREPFYKYNMGRTISRINADEVVRKIKEIENNYKDLQKGCHNFYQSVDLDLIVRNILESD